MAKLKLSLKFPYLKDDTRLILHENTLYKVKVRYDQKSFKGRPVMFTTTELSNEIEEVIRAVVYMFKKHVELQPIETKYFLILPKLTEWVFPTKYPNYVFKKYNKTLETCDRMIELYVKHIDEINEQEESEESEVIQQRTERYEIRKGKQHTTKSDSANESTSGSRFIRDESGKLCRVVNGQEQSEIVPSKQSSHAKSDSPENRRVMRKRTNDKTMDSSCDKNGNQAKKRSPRLGDDKHEQHAKAKQIETAPINTRQKHSNIKRVPTQKESKTQIPSVGKKPKPCVDCLEERQFRRRSGRLKTKDENCENTAENQTQIVTTNKKDSSSDIQSSPRRSTVPIQTGKEITNEIDVRDHMDLRISPVKRHKRNMNGLNTNNNSDICTEIKRRRQKVNSRQSSPAAVYRDILKNRNRDRYVVEQLERTETTKLGELYQVEGPRRSLRQAEKAGRLSGLWNRIWDTFFTPKK